MTAFTGYRSDPDRDTPARPTACPACGSKAVGTMATVISPETLWRCQACGESWKAPRTPARPPANRH